jgi:hypothetical protein
MAKCHKHVVREANAIFETLLSKPTELSNNMFAGVPITSDLITAYLSVQSSHTPVAEFPKEWLDTWQQVKKLGLSRTFQIQLIFQISSGFLR